MGSSSFLVCGGRGSIAAVSDEVLQWECMQLQSLWELQRNLWETTEKFMGAGFFGVEALQHVSSFYGISIKKGLWRARARRPDVWAKMSPFVSGVYTMLIL